MSDYKVSIIIPNWNGRKFLDDCLRSLRHQTYKNFNIIIVDNGSTDDSVDFVKNNYPEAQILESGENQGFAAACNKGAKFALETGSDFVLLLNNDTVVDSEMLTRLLEAASDSEVGIVGGKIYYFDEPQKIWYAGGELIESRASGKHSYWQTNDSPELRGVRETGFVTGCLMLIRKEVFDKAGYFYEPYFLTIEDLDFCYQAEKNGWKIKVALDAKIWHKVSSSREGEFSFSNWYYGTRNRLFFAFKRAKNYPAGLILLFLVIPIHIISWSWQKNRRKMLKGMLVGVWDFFRGKMGSFEPKK